MSLGNPILVEVKRGGIVESFHRGVICVVDEKGEIVYSKGDHQQVCFPRSALKYVQHIPLISSGIFEHFGFTNSDLALMCGSHNGEDFHVLGVQNLLKRLKFDDDILLCGPQNPSRKSDWISLIKKDLNPTCLHNNCSGKHAGFLAYNAYHGTDARAYLSSHSPLQKQIKQTVAKFAEIQESELVEGIDGCSAPTFAMPVYNQALIYKNLIAPGSQFNTEEKKAAQKVVDAVTAFPEMVAGTKRYCTDIMKITQGRIVGKTGADGVYCLAIPEKKWGISIKVDDGKMGPQYQIAQALLSHFNLLTEEETALLNPYKEFDILNFGGNKASQTCVVNI
jgi:L-asparaginase II